MSSAETSKLIDLIAATILPDLGNNEDAADQRATEIVGELQSKYLLIPLPGAADEDATRAQISALVPGLFPGRGASS